MQNASAYNLNEVFHALADPTRRAMLERLARNPLSVSDLAQPFKMSLVAISKHIKVLEKAKLVNKQKQGRTWMCQFNQEAMMTAEEWIAHYTTFWNERLDALEQFVNTSQKGDSNAEEDGS
jgi:DNA-binding transcriptional ArsR family regulator